MIDAAVCIGVNAYGHGNSLAGCVNDADDWAAALSGVGASVDVLLDGDATGANMVAAMRRLITNLRPGHTGVITYSGHGTQVPDDDGDEADGWDEAICPVDLWDNGVITDDVLHDLFTQRVEGSRLIFVSDSCHSGTISRFADVLGGGCERRVRFLPPATFMPMPAGRFERTTVGPVVRLARSSAATLAGCRDAEYSYDASFPGPDGQQRPNGAFTRAALDAWAGLPPAATLRSWQQQIRTRLPSRDYPQTPQLTATAAQKRWVVR